MKDNLGNFRFNDMDELKTVLKSCVKKQNLKFFQNGFGVWVNPYHKSVQFNGDYVEL